MDPKASAKAKRSHTQQGRKSHPTPASIAQKKKAAQVKSVEKVRRPHSQTLLSNWDRYDQREGEDKSNYGTVLSGGEFAPKSKGADFVYLIEQARSQQPETKASTTPESLPFFDGLTLDFMQAVSSVHTVREKNLLSRCENDNFVVDDDLTSSFEVPFLNLDLHALAAQLSKIKISERLFIEDYLFPEDLLSDESKHSSSSLQSETLRVIDAGRSRDASYTLPCSSPADVIGKAEGHNINLLRHSDFPQTLHPDQDNVQRLAVEAEESLANMSKSSTLKAGEAEAELDYLLDSFKETNLLGSIQDDLLDKTPASKVSFHDSVPMNLRQNPPNTGSINGKLPMEAELDDLLDSSKEINSFGSIHGSLLDKNHSSFKGQNSNFSYPIHRQPSIQARVSLKSAATTSIDDSLDVLLAETSPIMKIQNHPDPQLDSNRPHPPSGSSYIDDLLANVSVSRMPNYIVSPKEADSSKLGSIDVTDDFDSWIDTL